MLKKYFFPLFFNLFIYFAYAQHDLSTKFEQSGGTETVAYQEGITYLEMLDSSFDFIQLRTYGTTDCGKPLHLAVLSLDKDFEVNSLRRKGKNIVLINNNIHPGEPDGIDASLLLLRDIAAGKKPDLWAMMKNTVLLMIPFYNVDGVLNRGSYSRANQVGPKEYGFRGNARNLDLNRDFIKCDSENAKTFTEIFRTWSPDVYIENHVTNGADYQHTVTYLASQADKLGGDLGNYLRYSMIPDMEAKMTARKFEMCPYVNVFGDTPEKGYNGFLDSPRYSSGYAALFQTMGFIVETHMLKPFKQRVEGTYHFMVATLEHLQKNGAKIRTLRQEAMQKVATEQKNFPLSWELDKNQSTEITFKGYEARRIDSKVTGGKRLFYDKSKPFTQKTAFYNHFIPKVSVEKPIAYLIPQAWKPVIERLQNNQIVLKRLSEDQVIPIQAYYIENYETPKNPFEGHYLHTQVQVRKEGQNIQFSAGDYVIFVNQPANRYLIETLEPQGQDSFFAWNFFDSILGQKEYFSDYVFEDIAEKILVENADLKAEFEEKRRKEPEFAQNPAAQLDYIYRNSPYYEKSHRRYPVFRLEESLNLKLTE